MTQRDAPIEVLVTLRQEDLDPTREDEPDAGAYVVARGFRACSFAVGAGCNDITTCLDIGIEVQILGPERCDGPRPEVSIRLPLDAARELANLILADSVFYPERN